MDVDPQVLVEVYDMVTVPADTPVTVPVELTVARPGFPELQVPPPVVLDNAIDEPEHTLEPPVIGSGTAGRPFTVNTMVAAVEPQKLVNV